MMKTVMATVKGMFMREICKTGTSAVNKEGKKLSTKEWKEIAMLEMEGKKFMDILNEKGYKVVHN